MIQYIRVLVLFRGFEAKVSRILVQTLSRTGLTTDKMMELPRAL